MALFTLKENEIIAVQYFRSFILVYVLACLPACLDAGLRARNYLKKIVWHTPEEFDSIGQRVADRRGLSRGAFWDQVYWESSSLDFNSDWYVHRFFFLLFPFFLSFPFLFFSFFIFSFSFFLYFLFLLFCSRSCFPSYSARENLLPAEVLPKNTLV